MMSACSYYRCLSLGWPALTKVIQMTLLEVSWKSENHTHTHTWFLLSLYCRYTSVCPFTPFQLLVGTCNTIHNQYITEIETISVFLWLNTVTSELFLKTRGLSEDRNLIKSVKFRDKDHGRFVFMRTIYSLTDAVCDSQRLWVCIKLL